MKTRWSYNWVLAGLVGVGLPLSIYGTVIGARGPHPVLIVQLVLLTGGLLLALRAKSQLGVRDERETSIAVKASTLSFHSALVIAMLATAVLHFFVEEPTVPFRWLADAPGLFLLTQLGIKCVSEAVMLGREE